MGVGTLQLPTTGTFSGLTEQGYINTALAALANMIQGASAPTTTSTGLSSMAGVWWHDTGTNTIKVRDQADTTWITVAQLDETNKAALAAGVAGRNKVINGNFLINQRTYVSGTALASGVYAHDRWKAGASGCTYTFTQGSPDTTITITAGSLQQIIEGANIEGGNFVLSWTGSAQGRVNGGTYGASPLATGSLSAGSNVTIEFNTGTVGKVQLEVGGISTPFERRNVTHERMLCMRYYEKSSDQAIAASAAFGAGSGNETFGSNGNGGAYCTVRYKVPKRATGGVTLWDGAGHSGNVAYFDTAWKTGGVSSAFASFENSFFVQVNLTGLLIVNFNWEVSVEL